MSVNTSCRVLLVIGLAIVALLAPGQSAFAGEHPHHTNDPHDDSEEPSQAACSVVQYLTHEDSQTPSHVDKPEDTEAHFSTPPNPDGPTLVDLGLFIRHITDIDPVDSTFKIEGTLALVWCDPRLEFGSQQTDTPDKVFLQADVQVRIGEIWWPDIHMVNTVGKRTIDNEVLIIRADGTVEYQETFSAQAAAHYDLRNFPFDRQSLEIEIQSFAWSDEYLEFSEHHDMIGRNDKFEIPEWRADGIPTKIVKEEDVRSKAPFSEFVMNIEVTRIYGFYVWKMMLPLVLIVGISWAVFWMVNDSLGARMGVSFTGILVIIAYQFLMNNDLPKIAQITFMDSVIAFSFILMVLTVVESVVANSLSSQQKVQLATNVDRACRLAFPLVYAAGIAALVGIYLS